MAGETDLATMLSSLEVERRPGRFCFLTGVTGLEAVAEATVVEAEGLTVVVPVSVAEGAGHAVDFEVAWLTLRVHSSLAAVGLTAAVSRVLAEVGIPCNVLAGFHHDHLLVPAGRADDAQRAIESLRHPT